MKRRLVAAILASSSCTHVSQPEKFQLPQGEVMTCLQYVQESCGMTLRGCGAEHTVELKCLTEVTYQGPTEDPPLIYDETASGGHVSVEEVKPEAQPTAAP